MRVPVVLRWSEGITTPSRLFYIFLALIAIIVRFLTINESLSVMTPTVTLVEHCVVGLRLRDEILTELCAALVNRYGVTYNPRRTSGGIWESAALHPCVFEVRHTIDCVEETQEADCTHRTTEGLSERAHELEEPLLFLLLFFVALQSALPFLECPV
jgi:hypothetical protein